MKKRERDSFQASKEAKHTLQNVWNVDLLLLEQGPGFCLKILHIKTKQNQKYCFSVPCSMHSLSFSIMDVRSDGQVDRDLYGHESDFETFSQNWCTHTHNKLNIMSCRHLAHSFCQVCLNVKYLGKKTLLCLAAIMIHKHFLKFTNKWCNTFSVEKKLCMKFPRIIIFGKCPCD